VLAQLGINRVFYTDDSEAWQVLKLESLRVDGARMRGAKQWTRRAPRPVDEQADSSYEQQAMDCSFRRREHQVSRHGESMGIHRWDCGAAARAAPVRAGRR
jgi:hypothetical protein